MDSPSGFICDNEKGPLKKCQVSLKYIEANGKANDLKTASFLFYFKMSLLKFNVHFL